MLILGIDPGIARIGYGIVENKGNKFKLKDYGTITTSSDKKDVKRLKIIHEKLTELIEKFNPDHMAVEELFFNKNVKTAIRVGQARGVILLTGSEFDLEVAEYTPLQVKQAVVGYGRAQKQQVQSMVQALLNMKDFPDSDDAADALAVSICHGHSHAANEKWGNIL